MSETATDRVSTELVDILAKVFVQASGGRAMTPQFHTEIADACYDLSRTILEAVSEEYAVQYKYRG